MPEGNPSITPLQVAVKHCCPRCSEGRLYDGYLNVTEQCGACGLATGNHTIGDGPIYCAMTLLSFGVTGVAAWLEIAHTPPMWVHAVTALGLTLLLTPLSLRFFKSYMIANEYRHGALDNGAT